VTDRAGKPGLLPQPAQRRNTFASRWQESEGPEGLKKIYESLSIGFQVNKAIRIEHIMKRGLFGGFGLGVEEVRGLESRLSRSTGSYGMILLVRCLLGRKMVEKYILFFVSSLNCGCSDPPDVTKRSRFGIINIDRESQVDSWENARAIQIE
jgi:hypothetical protein